MIRIILVSIVALGMTCPAYAAGGGGSAGGSGAQNAINSGRTMADVQPGPVGAPNHPRPVPGEAAAKTDATPVHDGTTH